MAKSNAQKGKRRNTVEADIEAPIPKKNKTGVRSSPRRRGKKDDIEVVPESPSDEEIAPTPIRNAQPTKTTTTTNNAASASASESASATATTSASNVNDPSANVVDKQSNSSSTAAENPNEENKSSTSNNTDEMKRDREETEETDSDDMLSNVQKYSGNQFTQCLTEFSGDDILKDYLKELQSYVIRQVPSKKYEGKDEVLKMIRLIFAIASEYMTERPVIRDDDKIDEDWFSKYFPSIDAIKTVFGQNIDPNLLNVLSYSYLSKEDEEKILHTDPVQNFYAVRLIATAWRDVDYTDENVDNTVDVRAKNEATFRLRLANKNEKPQSNELVLYGTPAIPERHETIKFLEDANALMESVMGGGYAVPSNDQDAEIHSLIDAFNRTTDQIFFAFSMIAVGRFVSHHLYAHTGAFCKKLGRDWTNYSENWAKIPADDRPKAAAENYKSFYKAIGDYLEDILNHGLEHLLSNHSDLLKELNSENVCFLHGTDVIANWPSDEIPEDKHYSPLLQQTGMLKPLLSDGDEEVIKEYIFFALEAQAYQRDFDTRPDQSTYSKAIEEVSEPQLKSGPQVKKYEEMSRAAKAQAQAKKKKASGSKNDAKPKSRTKKNSSNEKAKKKDSKNKEIDLTNTDDDEEESDDPDPEMRLVARVGHLLRNNSIQSKDVKFNLQTMKLSDLLGEYKCTEQVQEYIDGVDALKAHIDDEKTHATVKAALQHDLNRAAERIAKKLKWLEDNRRNTPHVMFHYGLGKFAWYTERTKLDFSHTDF